MDVRQIERWMHLLLRCSGFRLQARCLSPSGLWQKFAICQYCYLCGVRFLSRQKGRTHGLCLCVSLLSMALQELAMAYSLSLAGAYLIMASGTVPELPL